MFETPESKRERCDDLLVQLALYGLGPSEQQELDELVRQFGIVEDERFENVVGVLDSAFDADSFEIGGLPERFSDQLRNQIVEDASQHVGGDSVSAEETEKSSSAESFTFAPLAPTAPVSDSVWSTREIVLAFVTAASLLFAIASFSGLSEWNSNASVIAPSVATQLTEFQQSQPGDLRVVSWTNPTSDAASADASGEVIWSDQEQRGFMVFDGLEVNDPKVKQYQLWIFDKARDDALPVDGGVFDIAADGGKVIIPIDAKLAISEATMFAITIEQSGGVVQSKRERLPLLAKVSL